MATRDLPIVGDVITSRKFAFGFYSNEDRAFVNVDGVTKKEPVLYVWDEEKRVALAAKSGKIPPKLRTVNLGAHDPSRAKAKFVVEAASQQGSDTGNGGWSIRARRLNKDGSYNLKGEVICFYMSGHFRCQIMPEDVKITGKMQMMFV